MAFLGDTREKRPQAGILRHTGIAEATVNPKPLFINILLTLSSAAF
jgi:hypothetical protein